jgi:hypothetical protein
LGLFELVGLVWIESRKRFARLVSFARRVACVVSL